MRHRGRLRRRRSRPRQPSPGTPVPCPEPRRSRAASRQGSCGYPQISAEQAFRSAPGRCTPVPQPNFQTSMSGADASENRLSGLHRLAVVEDMGETHVSRLGAALGQAEKCGPTHVAYAICIVHFPTGSHRLGGCGMVNASNPQRRARRAGGLPSIASCAAGEGRDQAGQ